MIVEIKIDNTHQPIKTYCTRLNLVVLLALQIHVTDTEVTIVHHICRCNGGRRPIYELHDEAP